MKGGKIMINNKRGLSGVIVTLITVLLAIVAIGIIWAVVSGLLERNVESIDLSTKCQGAVMKFDSVVFNGTDCNLRIKRLSSGDATAIDGAEIYFDSVEETDESGDIISTLVLSRTCTTMPEIMDIKVYFEDADTGEREYCTPVSTSEIIDNS